MNVSKQMMQESENLLLKKCVKCQNNAEFDSKYQSPLCKHCHEIEQIEEDSVIISGDYHTESKAERVQRDRFHSLPLIKKANSLQFEDQNQMPVKEIRKSPSRSYHSLVVQDGDTSEDSEQERLKRQENKLKQAVREDNLKLKIEKKVIVGSGFTFDMTDFFKFKKKQLGAQEQQTFFESISGSRIAWVILLYTICSTALIPGWIMNIKATKLLRQQWRFLMQALMVLPFAFYEKRTISKEQEQKYTLRYIFNPENIIKPYISSFASSLWFLFVLTSFQWTYVSHGVVLGSLSNFFLSLGRSFNKNSHDLQSGGQVLVVLGILLVLHDSISVQKHQISADQLSYLNTFYLKRSWWQRVGGDILAITTSFIMSQFSKYTSDLRSYYPPFLSLLLVNCFNVVNLTLMGFFFNGATFDFDPFWGIFSVFTDSHFTSFMYMAIVLAFGQLVSVVMITKMFPDPIIPAIAMTLQPFLACFFIDVAQIQNLPGNFAMIGFILIFPGMMLVLMGQCFFQRQKSSKEESDQRVKKLMEQIKQMKEKKMQRQTHFYARKHAGMSSKLTQSHFFSKKVHF